MVLIDTSVWIGVFRDKSGEAARAVEATVGEDDVVLTRFNQLELLQGCRDESEWELLSEYLDGQEYVELSTDSWSLAARVYFDLRRIGKTVRSPVDCCIAQVAMDHDLLLFHRDGDFETIAEIRPLRQLRIDW